MSEIKPVDPVLLGLCKQTELDEAVKKAAPPVVEEPAVEEPEAVVAEDVSEDAAPADAVSEDQV